VDKQPICREFWLFLLSVVELVGIIACGRILLTGSDHRTMFVAGVIFALLLFEMRRTRRFVYGVLEIVFGLYVLWDATTRGRGGLSSGFFNDDVGTSQISVVAELGAVYVLIRGLDNAITGWPAFRALVKKSTAEFRANLSKPRS
jgi:hypothetical protein